MVSLKGALGAFVIVVIGLSLAPTVLSMSTNDTVNGTTQTMIQLVPTMYAIGVLGAAVGSAVFL